MPKRVQARAAQDGREENQVRKLARSHHAPADGKFHAQVVVESRAGKTPNGIAASLHCHPKTVRIHLVRFNTEGISGSPTALGPTDAAKAALILRQDQDRSLLVGFPQRGEMEPFALFSSQCHHL